MSVFQQNSQNKSTWNVLTQHRWTLSNRLNTESADALKEVPYIELQEYTVDESTIRNQLDYYISGTGNFFNSKDDGSIGAFLKPYENLFIREEKNKANKYIFPYFSDINFQLSTPAWASLDTLEQAGKAVEGGAGMIGGDKAAAFVGGAINGVGSLAMAGLAASYPKVGIMDRPKLWQSHDPRNIEIKFPLFNTANANDWKINRDLCWTLVNQNLYEKTSFITGVPPVFYEITIPGQHYSYAACVTQLVINNRGNTRMLVDDNGYNSIVPDVYDVNITLTDLVIPSKNQFQYMKKGPVTAKIK